MTGNISSLTEQLEAFTMGQLPLHKLLAEFEAAISEDPSNRDRIADLLQSYLQQGEITISSYKEITNAIPLPSASTNSGEDSTLAATDTDGPTDSAHDLNDELEETVFSDRGSDIDEKTLPKSTETEDEGSIDLGDFTEQSADISLDDEATEVAIDHDATEVVAETSGSNSSWPAGAKQTTGSSWSDPSTWVDNGEPLGVGSVIKERFELVERLGIGGMGVVYKALDRRKVEAQARDPYLAVKILNDEFKQHPNALQALQREARKTQELAHPNIMTVYDFDRVGSDVYMTMEFLDGEPMDVVIKKRKGKPFPEEEAMVMIEGMGEALAYAHRRNLVHSDFKPGNVFLTKQGTIKVLDFGIAARVTNPIAGEEDDGADKTVFDVKQFGAFTPAYATCEIMEGSEPDPRDDIYALGCVSYQLLAGKHPFNRKRATFARDNGLVPEPIPTLTRRQQKALNKSLSFSHAECTPTVEEFIDGMRRRKSRLIPIAASIAAILIVGVFALQSTIVNYLQEQEQERIMALLTSGDQQQIVSGLDELRQTDGTLRSNLISAARETILGYYETQTGQLIDDAQGSYNFPLASSLVDEARALYPDSAQIERMLETIDSRKNRLLNQLTNRFNAALENGHLLESADTDDIKDVLALVSQINPDHPLLNDPRLPPAYVAEAEKALTSADYSLASSLALAGLDHFPKNISLINLRDEIDAARQQVEEQARITELASQLESKPLPTTVSGYDAIRAELLEMQELAPDSTILAEYQQAFQTFLPDALNGLITSKQWSEGFRLLADYGDLLSSGQIISQQQKLVTANQNYDDRVSALLQNFENRLGDGANSSTALDAATDALTQLSNYASADDPGLLYARNRIAYGYLSLARQARAGGNLENLERFARAGLDAQPEGIVEQSLTTELTNSSQATIATGDTQQLSDEFDNTLAQATNLNTSLLPLIKLLEQIAAIDPVNEKIQQGRSALGTQLADQVNTLIAAGEWENATELAQSSRLMLPELSATNTLLAQVDSARQSAEAEIKTTRIDSIANSLHALLADARFDSAWEAEIRGNWRRLRPLLSDSPERLKTEEDLIAQTFLASAEKSQSAQLFVEARNRLRSGQRILPDNPAFQRANEALAQSQANFRQLELSKARSGEIEGYKQTLLTQTKARDLAEAGATLAKLKRLLPADDPFVTQEVPELLGPTYIEMAKSLGDQEKFVEALKLARAGLSVAPDLSELKSLYDLYENEAVLAKLATQFENARGPSTQASDILKKRITAARQRSPERADQLVTEFSNLFAERAAQTANSDKPAYRAWLAKGRALFPGDTRFASAGRSSISGRACTDKIAGYGKRKAGICFDVVAQKSRGPLMVVIPSEQPYAMSKYEISLQDFDLFCTESGKCTASGGDPRMPVADVSFDLAVEYANWLSEQTGKTYRLPSDEEWVYAATGDGNLGKDFNCLLKLGGNVIKGASLLPINSGKANNWGLHNPVGNVQELTAEGTARGGAYKDTMSNCDISLKRDHSGSGDGITGFRVLQELKG